MSPDIARGTLGDKVTVTEKHWSSQPLLYLQPPRPILRSLSHTIPQVSARAPCVGSTLYVVDFVFFCLAARLKAA